MKYSNVNDQECIIGMIMKRNILGMIMKNNGRKKWLTNTLA